MKMILVFMNGQLIRQISYKTKRDAAGNFKLFKKHGISDIDGLPISGATFELI